MRDGRNRYRIGRKAKLQSAPSHLPSLGPEFDATHQMSNCLKTRTQLTFYFVHSSEPCAQDDILGLLAELKASSRKRGDGAKAPGVQQGGIPEARFGFRGPSD